VGGTPQQFADHVRAERDQWSKVIKQAGIRAN
jgi:tripartite-type tricarboxylate transporter receptor subunit TctC